MSQPTSENQAAETKVSLVVGAADLGVEKGALTPVVKSVVIESPVSPVADTASSPRPTFQMACWLLALVGFLQLGSIGLALISERNTPVLAVESRYAGSTASPVQARSLDEILSGAEIAPQLAVNPAGFRSPEDWRLPPSDAQYYGVNDAGAQPKHTNLPMIANPRVERLVNEANKSHMDGDVARAILKLDEAARIDAEEPAVMYHKAKIYENMAYFVKAADEYQKIQQMGAKSGAYFSIAAKKLTEGMDTAEARRGVMSIGLVYERKEDGAHGVRSAELVVPILARPDTPVNADDVEVNVYLYDQISGSGDSKVEKSGQTAIIEKSWLRSVRNWQNGRNEESLKVSYKIPDSDYTDEYLFGKREYYGFVIELVYKGELVDQQAKPRKLHSIHAASRPSGDHYRESYGNPTGPYIPDGGETLLPRLNEDVSPGHVFPPLPSHQ